MNTSGYVIPKQDVEVWVTIETQKPSGPPPQKKNPETKKCTPNRNKEISIKNETKLKTG